MKNLPFILLTKFPILKAIYNFSSPIIQSPYILLNPIQQILATPKIFSLQSRQLKKFVHPTVLQLLCDNKNKL